MCAISSLKSSRSLCHLLMSSCCNVVTFQITWYLQLFRTPTTAFTLRAIIQQRYWYVPRTKRSQLHHSYQWSLLNNINSLSCHVVFLSFCIVFSVLWFPFFYSHLTSYFILLLTVHIRYTFAICMYVCMDGWMDGRIDGRTDGLMDGLKMFPFPWSDPDPHQTQIRYMLCGNPDTKNPFWCV